MGLDHFNPGLEMAEVTIEVYTAEGVKSGEPEMEIDPGKTISKLLRELIPSRAVQVRHFTVIRSTVGLVAQGLFGDLSD